MKNSMNYSIESSLKSLEDKGVIIIDPRQVYVSPDLDLDRIYPGSVLYPGTRLTGKRTLIGTGAEIGVEGPATVNDSVMQTAITAEALFLRRKPTQPTQWDSSRQ